jgi:hypothetical protein
MTIRRLLIVMVLVAISGGAVAADTILRVSVLANGQLRLNGAPTTLAKLDTAFVALKADGGVVWYYREGADAEPPVAAMKVIELIVKRQVPISMSSKPDFSDVIDADGISHPRPNISLQRDRER